MGADRAPVTVRDGRNQAVLLPAVVPAAALCLAAALVMPGCGSSGAGTGGAGSDSSETVRTVEVSVTAYADGWESGKATLHMEGCCANTSGRSYDVDVRPGEAPTEEVAAGAYHITWSAPAGYAAPGTSYVVVDDRTRDEHIAEKAGAEGRSEAEVRSEMDARDEQPQWLGLTIAGTFDRRTG